VQYIRLEAHILLNQNQILHTNLEELAQKKIPALRGRVGTSNTRILETIAIEGPLLKYDIYKKFREDRRVEYSTITRRIDSLKAKGYLDKAGTRKTERGKRKAEALYGLTWKGFISSFVNQNVRENVLHVIERNPLLAIPEKQFVLLILREIFTPEEIEKVTGFLLYGLMRIIPNLEDIEEEGLPLWILQGISQLPPSLLDGEMPRKKKDLIKLLDNPKILQYVKDRILPLISKWERDLHVLFQFFNMLNQVGDFIKELHPSDKPSKRLKAYLKTKKFEERLASIGE